jgi:hypothetical protein
MFLRESIAANSHEGKFLFRLGQHKNGWQVIFFKTRTGDVTLNPVTGYTKNWRDTSLEIDN